MKQIFLLFIIVIFSLNSFSKINGRFTRPLPHGIEVLLGNFPGHTAITVNGHNPAVGTTDETLWSEGGVVVFPSSASNMTLSSSDVNDTAAGSGLQTVQVDCINKAAGTQTIEVVTMNGQTPVAMTAQCDRINFLVGLTAGATGSNEGIIYIGTGTVTTGKPAVVVNLIGVGMNKSDSGFFTVPPGKNALLTQLVATAEGLKVITLEGFIRKNGGLFTLDSEYNLFNSPLPLLSMTPPSLIPSLADVEFRSRIFAGSGDVKTTCVFTLINVDL